MKFFITLLILASPVFTFAQTVEFRTFTIKEKTLTIPQIQNALEHNHLAENTSIILKFKEGEISYSNLKKLTYAKEYNADLSVAINENRQLGTIIKGSLTEVGNDWQLTFQYSFSSCIGYQPFSTKEDRAIIMPIFRTKKAASTITLNPKDPQWILTKIITIDAEKDSTYLAVKIVK